LDEKVGQKGIKLSAGQQQRLNIIREILLVVIFIFLMNQHLI
jgi:ABC-type multidrug transport system fused ATPase/permease subunit